MEISINVPIVRHEDVILDDASLKAITASVIRNVFAIPNDCYIQYINDSPMLMLDTTPGYQTTVRAASENDIAAFRVLEQLLP